MDNPLFVHESKSISYLLRPPKYVSRIHGFCWCYLWVVQDLTLQVSFALFHHQDHSCDACFLEKGCAIKLYNVRMVQFSDQENKKTQNILKSNATFALFPPLDYAIFNYLLCYSPQYSDHLPNTSE